MLPCLGNGLDGPVYFLYEREFAYGTIHYLADFAGGGFAVIHMEIKLDFPIGILCNGNDKLLHLIMCLPKLKVPREGKMGIDMEVATKLLNLHIMDIYPLGFAMFIQELCNIGDDFGICLIHYPLH